MDLDDLLQQLSRKQWKGSLHDLTFEPHAGFKFRVLLDGAHIREPWFRTIAATKGTTEVHISLPRITVATGEPWCQVKLSIIHGTPAETTIVGLVKTLLIHPKAS